MNRTCLGRCAASIFALSLPLDLGGVHAQGLESGQAVDPGVIIVTAQRRDQNLQEVPISIQAFGGDALLERRVADAADVLGLVSNVSMNAENEVNAGITIRGVGTNNFHGNVNRAVGIYFDELTMGTPYSGVLGVFDMERVEVLRGPQNTLFGRNTTGGAINYISKKPKVADGFNGYGRFTYGRFNQTDFEGAIGVPLGEDIAMRGAFQVALRDGPWTNLAPGRVGEKLGKRERYSGRLHLRWQGGDTDVTLSAFGGSNRGNTIGNLAHGLRDPSNPNLACPLAEMGLNADFGGGNDCVAITGFNPSAASYDDRSIFNISSARSDVDVHGGSLTVNHDFGFAALTSISGYVRTDVQLADETSGFDTLQIIPHQDSDFEQISQEIRLVSDGGGHLRWIVGGFYFREDLTQGTLIRRDGNGAHVPGGQTIALNILDQRDEDLSAYGQFDFDLSDRLTFTAGLRYTNNRKRADSLFGVAVAPVALIPASTFISRDLTLSLLEGAPESCPPGPPGVDADGRPFGGPPPCTLPLLRPRQTINRLGARVGFDYKLWDDGLVYLNYSRGFKSGGFDTRALAAFSGNAEVPVGPETLNAYEIGIRSQTSDRVLTLNASAFYYDWKGLQTFSVLNGIPAFVNIPKSEIRGFELEATVRPGADLSLQFGLGYLDTEIVDAGGLTGVDEGHRLPNSPKWTANLSATKEFGPVQFQVHGRYIGKETDSLSFNQDFLTRNPAQFYLDLQAAYSFGIDRRFQLSGFVKNVTGQKYCADYDVFDNPFSPTPGDLSSVVACAPGNEGTPLWGFSLLGRF